MKSITTDQYIPKILQNAIFGLLLFTPRLRKKVHNRAGYSSLFCEAWTKKSSRPKHSILKYLGYIFILIVISVLTGCGPSEDSELRRYIDEVNSRAARPIERIPEFTPMSKFSYPEDVKRRSPFKPILAPQQVDTYAPNTNRPKQALEAFPLDALKFVGVLREGPVIWGLIRQPDGLVSRVKRGDYMGKNFGQIVSIKEDEIKIEETVQDSGKWEKKPITLKLNSPEQESGKTKQ